MIYRHCLLWVAGLFLPLVFLGQTSLERQPTLSLEDERGFLGIYSGEMSRAKAEILGFDNPYGSYVTRVIPGSGAERAGLLPFDYVYGIDERRVSRSADLTDLLDAYEPGDEVTVHLIRDGDPTTLPAVLGYRSSTSYRSTPEADQPFFGISPHDDNEDDELGVRVEVIYGSTAEELNLQTGDLLLAINGFPMVDWSDISTAIDNMVPGQPIQVLYERGNEEYLAEGSIRSRREANRAIEEARRQEPAFMGIYSGLLEEDKAEKLGIDNPYGSYVTGIIPGTAAERSGLMPFDYIFGVDQYRVGEYQTLSHILRKYRAGDEATLYIIRRGEIESLPIVFGERDERDDWERDPCDDPFLGVRHQFNADDLGGVGISVVENSTAEALGLRDGDIITAINGYPIFDWDDLGTAVDLTVVGEPIAITYRRDGEERSGTQPIQSQCDRREETDYGFDNDAWPPGGDRVPRRVLPEDMEMEMEDLTAAEAAEMEREHGVEMPTDQNLRIEGLNLFPNPSSGQFNLQFNLPNRGDTAIRIFNASGRLIYNYELGGFSGEFNDEVDISQNGTGSYFLQISQGGRSVSKKVILSRR